MPEALKYNILIALLSFIDSTCRILLYSPSYPVFFDLCLYTFVEIELMSWGSLHQRAAEAWHSPDGHGDTATRQWDAKLWAIWKSAEFVRQMPKGKDIFLVSLPHISMRIKEDTECIQWDQWERCWDMLRSQDALDAPLFDLNLKGSAFRSPVFRTISMHTHTHTIYVYYIIYMNHRIMYNISSGRIYGRLWHMITHVPRCQRDS